MFVQTSTHEGFCLPLLEAMATGCAVVCTDAHGNRDFCVDEANCLMPEPDRPAVARARRAGCSPTPALRSRLGQAGIATAGDYAWGRRIDALERFMFEIARPRRIAARRSRAGRGRLQRAPAVLEVLGDPRGDAVEHPEAEHEDPHHDRERHRERAPSVPSSCPALGVAWVMKAWRNCWKIAASGLSM